MNSSLVIFDCDGVLIDSEIVVHRVASKEMSNIGFPLTVDRSIEVFSGAANDDFLSIIQNEYGRDISHQDLQMIISKIEAAIKTDLQSIENISQVIVHLDNNQIEKCIASNSLYDDIINSLSLSGLDEYFDKDKIFSVSMVNEGKPEPDLFLHAAKSFDVLPEDCIVIEDSVVGIKAAQAAKMPVIGFLGASHAKSHWYIDSIVKAKPDLIVDDAFELLGLFVG